ncbi:hypothetical protein P9112_006509 [Eukaryota sp. TZLM1-RC]
MMTDHVSSEEVQQYDRQIRVWGFETQSRLKNARIWVVSLNSVGSEVVKNLALAGVGSILLIDNRLVSDIAPQSFLIRPDADPSQTVAQASLDSALSINAHCNIIVKEDLNPCSDDIVIHCSTILEPIDTICPRVWCFSASHLCFCGFDFEGSGFASILSRLKASAFVFSGHLSSVLCTFLSLMYFINVERKSPSFSDLCEFVNSKVSKSQQKSTDSVCKQVFDCFQSNESNYPASMAIAGLCCQEVIRFIGKTDGVDGIILFDLEEGKAPIVSL